MATWCMHAFRETVRTGVVRRRRVPETDPGKKNFPNQSTGLALLGVPVLGGGGVPGGVPGGAKMHTKKMPPQKKACLEDEKWPKKSELIVRSFG